MRRQGPDPLRDLLNREVEAFAAAAQEAKDGLSAQRLETIARLAKVIEIRDAARRTRRNWWPALVFVGTVAVLSVLCFATVRETEIELEIWAGQISFTLAKEQVVTETLAVSSLGVSGVRTVELPQSEEVQPSAISVTPGAEGGRSGSLTLAPLSFPANASLRLQRLDSAKRFRLSTNAAGLAVQATIAGPTNLAFASMPARTLDFPRPRSIVIHKGAEDLDVDLAFQTLPQSPLAPQIAVRQLSFLEIDQFLAPDSTLVRHLSTILSGTLYFESLNGQERRLRAGEQLQFDLSRGVIRTVELAGSGIGLKFHGLVRGMTTGTGEGRRSLMPTYVEWLRARHGLSLLWATALYAFGLVAAALRWWGIRI